MLFQNWILIISKRFLLLLSFVNCLNSLFVNELLFIYMLKIIIVAIKCFNFLFFIVFVLINCLTGCPTFNQIIKWISFSNLTMLKRQLRWLNLNVFLAILINNIKILMLIGKSRINHTRLLSWKCKLKRVYFR